MKAIITIIITLLIYALVSAAEGWLLLMVWNWLTGSIAGLPAIPSFSVAFAICALFNLIFK